MGIKIVTYNIDGLPESLDLRKLPWPLKPISWLYKAFRGTTCVTINDNKKKAANTKEISRRLYALGANIIAVQEDFNYHNELMSHFPVYERGNHSGGITIDNLRWFPYPRFKADGLNIITNPAYAVLMDEHIEPWEKSHGYFAHANDKLTTKGFRCYTIVIANRIPVRIFIVHMDADFYSPDKHPDVSKDVAARKSQFEQLARWINLTPNYEPTIIMGDFNSYPKYEWDKENIGYFLSLVPNLQQVIPENREDCDHIFVRGINVKRCYFDLSFGNLSDHKPLIAELEL